MLYYLLRCHSTVLYNNCGLKFKVAVKNYTCLLVNSPLELQCGEQKSFAQYFRLGLNICMEQKGQSDFGC